MTLLSLFSPPPPPLPFFHSLPTNDQWDCIDLALTFFSDCIDSLSLRSVHVHLVILRLSDLFPEDAAFFLLLLADIF